MPRRSVRRKNRKPMKKRKSLRKRSMRKRKTKKRKSRKGKSRRKKRRVTLKINERINMKKIQSGGGAFGRIMSSIGLDDVSLGGSGIMNTIKSGYQTYIGGNDHDSASPIKQNLSGNNTSSVVPDVPANMQTAAGELPTVSTESVDTA